VGSLTTICVVVTSTETESAFKDPVYESAVEASALLSAASDPSRMTILRILVDGPACVCTLQQHVPVAPNALSYHLKVLREAGLITGRRRGRWVDYELVDDALARLRDAIPATQSQPSRVSPSSTSTTERSFGSPHAKVRRISSGRLRHLTQPLSRNTSHEGPHGRWRAGHGDEQECMR
jgi:ArsR family transcriptional regulator